MTGVALERFDEQAQNELQALGDAMLKSGLFGSDLKSVAAAMVKVMAGREIGLGPVEAMRSLNIVKGKLDLSSDLLAQRVRMHPRYDYRVVELDNAHCILEFMRDGEPIGVSKFDDDDRALAGLALEESGPNGMYLTPWAKYPRNMMFARAMSNGVAWYCPDVVASLPMPVAIDVDGAGEPGVRSATGEVSIGVDSESTPAPPATSTIETGPPKTKHKATQAQLAKLMALAGEFGWSDDERHERAGVESFTELTRSAASLLIEAWSAEGSPPNTGGGDEGAGGDSEPDAVADAAPASPPAPDPDGAPTDELIARARKHISTGTDGALTVALRQAGFADAKFPDVTHGQLAAALEHRLNKGKAKS